MVIGLDWIGIIHRHTTSTSTSRRNAGCLPRGKRVTVNPAPPNFFFLHACVRVSKPTGLAACSYEEWTWDLYRAHLMALVYAYVHGPGMAPRASLHMILTRFSEGKIPHQIPAGTRGRFGVPRWSPIQVLTGLDVA